MERFSGGGEMEMSGEEDNLVQSVVDDLRKNGEKRETSSDNRGGERGGGGGRERGRDWRERENDSITRQKESLSSASSRNVPWQERSHKLTGWKI